MVVIILEDEILNIQITDHLFGAIEMVSVNGQLIKKINPKSASLNIKTDNWLSGIYFIRFVDGEEVGIKRSVKK